MKIIKRLAAILMIGVFSLSMVACAADTTDTEKSATTEVENAEDVVIAKVGDGTIYKSAFDEQMTYIDYMLKLQYGEDYSTNEEAMAYYEDQKQQVLQYLVESEVLVQKAKSLDNIVVTDEEVEEELELTKAEFDSEEAFNEALEQSSLTLEELKADIKESLIISKMVTEYTSGVEVSDEEVETYYKDNIDKYITKAGATISHILVETEEEAEKIKKEYEAGATFEDLAAKYGTDGTKDTGGSLGYIAYDSTDYDADFLAGAKKLAEGEVSEPVKTQFGWHLIKVTGVQKEDITLPLEDVKDEVFATIEEEKQFEKFNEHLDAWKAEMKIETFEDRL